MLFSSSLLFGLVTIHSLSYPYFHCIFFWRHEYYCLYYFKLAFLSSLNNWYPITYSPSFKFCLSTLLELSVLPASGQQSSSYYFGAISLGFCSPDENLRAHLAWSHVHPVSVFLSHVMPQQHHSMRWLMCVCVFLWLFLLYFMSLAHCRTILYCSLHSTDSSDSGARMLACQRAEFNQCI